MSYIRKIGKNYVIQIHWQGKTRQFSLRVSDKKNTETLQKVIDYELAMGSFSPNKFFAKRNATVTLADLKEKFFKFLDDRTALYSPGTISIYKYDFEILIKIVGDIEVAKITPEYVENFILTYLYANYKYTYVRHLMITFRVYFSKAVEWQMISSNPFSKKVPKAEKKKPRYLRQDEIEQVREYFSQDFLPAWQYQLVFLTLNTGLRKSEVFNLTWDHIDLMNEQMIFPGKSSKERVVPLNDHALAILNELAKAKVRHISKRVFYKITNPDSINTAWRKFRSRTGIKVRFHDLRVTYASYFMMNGGDILALKDILGHEDLKTVMVYAGLSREALHRNKNVVGF